MIKWAASAGSPRGGRASGRQDHGRFCAILGRASGPKIAKILDSVSTILYTLIDAMTCKALDEDRALEKSVFKLMSAEDLPILSG